MALAADTTFTGTLMSAGNGTLTSTPQGFAIAAAVSGR